jgi:4'-phosphopantetheinyl transferase
MAREDDRPTCEVWFATPEAANRLDPARLDPSERVAWNRLRTSRRRLDWAASRALKQAVSDDAPGDGTSSLSHSRGHATVARAFGSASIGVDLEWLAPRDFLGLARTAFAPDEVLELESLKEPARLCARFYEYWTLKEAFAKALQLPLADALGQCRFAVAGTAAARLPTSQAWRAVVYAPRALLRLAVVSVGGPAPSRSALPLTVEWPPRREADWPVVRSLDSAGTAGLAPC